MKILCFGDSNTYGYDPRSYFGSRYRPEHRWVDLLAKHLDCIAVNEGENGREIPRREGELLRFHRMLTSEKPFDLLIVMLGVNDLLQGNSTDVILKRMEAFLKLAELEKSKILLIGSPPMQLGEWVPNQDLIGASEELCDKYKDLTDRIGIGFADTRKWNIPMTFDGVHFTEEGHKIFAQRLCEYLSDKL